MTQHALPRLRHPEVSLRFIPECLRKAGYSERGICGFLDVTDIPSLPSAELPGYAYRCERDGSPCAAMIQLWLLGRSLPRARLEAVFGRRGVALLIARGLVRSRAEGKLHPNVSIFPCGGGFFITDLFFSDYSTPNQVYYVGQDSYVLAYLTPRRAAARTLDLCCGSGIHAILTTRHSDSCLGIDLNPRALEFARANAEMNSCSEACLFVRAKLGKLGGIGRFDLVVANPPWVPSPDRGLEWFRFGGRDGEDLTRLAVSGLRHWLEPRGTFAMFVIYPEIRGSDYLDRLQAWCGRGGRGFGIALNRLPETSLESFVASQLSPLWSRRRYETTFRRWLESYERLKIDGVGTAVVLVRRLAPGEPGFAVERPIPWPNHPMPEAVEDWLGALERIFSPRFDGLWRSWVPTKAPWPEWSNVIQLEGDEAWLAARLDGRTPAQKLAKALGKRFRLSERVAARRTRVALERLVVRGEAS